MEWARIGGVATVGLTALLILRAYKPEWAPFLRMAVTVVALGLTVALATNPIFPMVAQTQRLSWAGLKENDFIHITAYENSRHCKPNPEYYKDIMAELNLGPEECVMVGNDVGEDMIAEKLGMKVFLLTDCLINRKNEDISKYPHGGFKELADFLNSI